MADKNPNWVMTNGNHRARGWTQNDEGNWIPSLHDRRRVAVSMMEAIAEVTGGAIHGPVVGKVLKANSTGKEDFKVLADNFNKWMASVNNQ